jgi:ribosomal protein S18 acetylase RimI-like enzyme
MIEPEMWDAGLQPGVPYTLRTFIYEQDFEAVIQLWQTAGPGVHLGRSDQPEEIQKKLKRDPQLFLVAEAGDRIVGTVLGGFDGRRGMVYHLAVDPACRQQGIGEALMAALEERLRAIGCRRCYLLVVPENRTAMRFYEQRGWEQMKISIYGKNLD